MPAESHGCHNDCMQMPSETVIRVDGSSSSAESASHIEQVRFNLSAVIDYIQIRLSIRLYRLYMS